MRLGYISESPLLLGLPIAPLACFFELFYALQHSNKAQLREGHLDDVEKRKILDKTICARSNPEYSLFW
jgi:hypothetical protein